MSNRQNPIFHLGREAFHSCPAELGERLFLEMKERKQREGMLLSPLSSLRLPLIGHASPCRRRASGRKTQLLDQRRGAGRNRCPQREAGLAGNSSVVGLGRAGLGSSWTRVPCAGARRRRFGGRPTIVPVKHSLGSAASAVSLPLCVCLSLIKWTSSRCQAQ